MNTRATNEVTFALTCEDVALTAVLHLPANPAEVGVVVVVGGPQYRVGSHRQFVLLGRKLAESGFSTLRFDYRGIGDSGGELRGFQHVNDDIRAAVDALIARAPNVRRVILWGLCDGATAACFYAPNDPRVTGLVLLNPWIRSEQTYARSIMFHYYRDRLLDRNAWRTLLSNPAAVWRSIVSVVSTAKSIVVRKPVESREATVATDAKAASTSVPLVLRVGESLDEFGGPLLMIMSGADITANEFIEGVRGNRRLRRRLDAPNVTQHTLPIADHTFSRREWRDTVAQWTCEWLEDRRDA